MTRAWPSPFLNRALTAATPEFSLSLKSLHKFSSTQFNLADAGYSRTDGPPLPKIEELRHHIVQWDLAQDGYEDEPHVTVKYGLHVANPKEVVECVRGWLHSRRRQAGGGAVHAKLGKVSAFAGSEFDVVKIEVQSSDLRDLNHHLCKHLGHTDTHPRYSPHVTLAYVKSGAGRKYEEMGLTLGGLSVTFTKLIFSDPDGHKTVIDFEKERQLFKKKAKSLGGENPCECGCDGSCGCKSASPQDGHVVSLDSLKKADFITYGPKIKEGSNCSSCEYNSGGVCRFVSEEKGIDLRGLVVTERDCCGEWDAEGTQRLWKSAAGAKALSAYNLTTGGALVGAKYPPEKEGKSVDTGNLKRKLAKLGEELAHRDEPPFPMPGYGQIYVNDTDADGQGARVWYVGGDGDDDGWIKLVEKKVREVWPALPKGGFRAEAEAFPPEDEPGWNRVYPVRGAKSLWDEQKHPRGQPENKGGFASKPGGGGQGRAAAGAGHTPTGPPARRGKPRRLNPHRERADLVKQAVIKLGMEGWEAVKKLGASAGAVEHAAQEWAEHKIAERVQTLPEKLQALVRGAWLAVRVGTKAAFTTYRMGQKLAYEVAKERGADEATAARLRSIVSAVDVATYKPAMIAISAVAGPAAALGASFIPIGSLTYLAYSTAADPLVILRAARRLVGLSPEVKALQGGGSVDISALLIEIMDFVGDDDGRTALVLAALDAKQDLAQAIQLAKQAHQQAGEMQAGAKHFVRGRDARGRKYCAVNGRRVDCGDMDSPQGNEEEGAGSGGPQAGATADGGQPKAGGGTQTAAKPHGNPPPRLPWRDPPAPVGEVGRGKVGGFATVGTFGVQLAEAVSQHLKDLGFTPVEEGPLDWEYNGARFAFKLKVFSSGGNEYRVKPPPGLLEEKRNFARQKQYHAGMIAAVVDSAKGEVLIYWRLGVGAFNLSPDDRGRYWNYLGTAQAQTAQPAKPKPKAKGGAKSLRDSPFRNRGMKGGWVTVGGTPGLNGQHEGGRPVFIEDMVAGASSGGFKPPSAGEKPLQERTVTPPTYSPNARESEMDHRAVTPPTERNTPKPRQNSHNMPASAPPKPAKTTHVAPPHQLSAAEQEGRSRQFETEKQETSGGPSNETEEGSQMEASELGGEGPEGPKVSAPLAEEETEVKAEAEDDWESFGVGEEFDVSGDAGYYGQVDTDMEREHSQYLSGLGAQDLQTLRDYTGADLPGGGFYEELNSAMRTCGPPFDCVPENLKGPLDNLMGTLEKAPKLKTPIFTYRGLNLDQNLTKELADRFRDMAYSGEDFQMPSFTSSTVNAGPAFDLYSKGEEDYNSGIVFKIKARSGVYLESITTQKGEKEFLQSPNVRYRVVAVSNADVKSGSERYQRNVVYLDELP